MRLAFNKVELENVVYGFCDVCGLKATSEMILHETENGDSYYFNCGECEELIMRCAV